MKTDRTRAKEYVLKFIYLIAFREGFGPEWHLVKLYISPGKAPATRSGSSCSRPHLCDSAPPDPRKPWFRTGLATRSLSTNLQAHNRLRRNQLEEALTKCRSRSTPVGRRLTREEAGWPARQIFARSALVTYCVLII